MPAAPHHACPCADDGFGAEAARGKDCPLRLWIRHRTDGAISKAGETVRQMSWFEVVQIRGRIEAGKIDSYQVTLKAGFKLED
jgi:dodecin